MVAWVVNSRLHPRLVTLFRHVTKNPSPQVLMTCALTNRNARNSFRMCSYENCRVSPALNIDFLSSTLTLSASATLSFRSWSQECFTTPFPSVRSTLFFKTAELHSSISLSSPLQDPDALLN